MSKKLLYLMCFVLVLAVTGTATAVQYDITVGDAGFDDYSLGPGGYVDIASAAYYTTVPDGWKCQYGEAWIDNGYYADEDDLPALSPKNKAYGYEDYIYQILDETYIEGGTYTLSVWTGAAWPSYPRAWGLYFTTEDYTVNLIEASGLAPGYMWEQISLSYTATAADTGKKVGIKMYGDEYVTFEDVTLSYDGPPGTSIATKPIPADGAEHDAESALLFWTGAWTAAEHDVYFGTDFDDVNDATASEPPVDPYKGRQTDNFYDVFDLVPGTTYYWRIDEVNDPNIWKGVVWSFWLTPWEPTNPSPSDGAIYMDVNVDLSWKAGFAAGTHEVFFGTDPCALPSVIRFSGEPTYDPGTLLKGTTYYWQVKETYKSRRTLGPIWSFSTTLPTMGTCLYEYWDGITPTGNGLSLLYNWPDFPGNPTGTQILTLFEGPTNRQEQFGARIQAWLYAPVTGDYKFWIATDDNGELWLSTDDNPANKQLISTCGLAGVGWAAPQNWLDPDVTPSGLIHLVAGEKYYIEALMKEGSGGDNIAVGWTTPWDNTIQVILGSYLEPFVQLWAWDPSPADGTPEASRPIMLRWKAGAYAAQHQVYFGTSEASMTLQDTLAVGTEEYDPYGTGTLDPGQTYYWKINEVNVAGPDPYIWEGDVWNFTVIDYFIVDDMEGYTDRPSIETIWRDGYVCVDWGEPAQIPPVTGGCSGSNVDVASGVGGGTKAMVFNYDNDGETFVPGYPTWPYPAPYYSEVKANTLNLPIGSKDWSEAKALSLWFYGDAGNDIEPMWVKLTDQGGSSGKVTYGDYGEDPNDLKDPSWHEWNIPLSDFGVNTADVNNISIGFGDEDNETTPGGSGVVYFDDIRLYATRCVLSLRSPDFARADFVEDCVVDYKEVKVMAENWLAVVPIAIVNPGFEDPVLAENAYTWLDVPGWTQVDVNNGGAGVWNVTTADFDPPCAPEGQNVLYTENLPGPNLPGGVANGVAQVLTEMFAANKDYTLTVEVGNSWEYWLSGYRVQLLAGGTVIADDNDTVWPNYYEWETSIVEYTYDSGDSALVGQPLEIRLLNLGLDKDHPPPGNVVGVEFDNVTLLSTETAPRIAERRVDLYEDEDMTINFKDFAKLAVWWLDEQLYP